jgi:predicted DsbA family dithiol-disulfide isomerase
MEKPVIKVAIVSDVVCPWCYIGKRRLEKAIATLSEKYTFELVYHPFELNAGIPKNGVNQREYLINKFGGEERYDQLTEHTTSVAAEEGLTFDFKKQHVSPNTRNLHSVAQLAKEKGKQLEVIEGFFKAYFTDGIDLSKDENIVKVATGAGLEEEAVKKQLADDTGRLQVALEEKEMSKLGITGVPFYIINNTYGISGAQHSDTFIQAFEEVSNLPSTNTAETCDVDGQNC